MVESSTTTPRLGDTGMGQERDSQLPERSEGKQGPQKNARFLLEQDAKGSSKDELRMWGILLMMDHELEEDKTWMVLKVGSDVSHGIGFQSSQADGGESPGTAGPGLSALAVVKAGQG